MLEKPVFYVIAGVNGSGKSSIGESEFNREGSPIFNPDTVAQQICTLHPNIPLTLANAHAWQIGKSLLEQAMAEDSDYRFETALGGRTIAQLLENAARSGHRLRIWFCGLVSPELHLQRVRSRENLIRLLPVIDHLRVHDNSKEADPDKCCRPQPVLLLEMQRGQITAPADLSGAPDWAQPIIAAAIHLHTGR
jgi:hypothetical protein